MDVVAEVEAVRVLDDAHIAILQHNSDLVLDLCFTTHNRSEEQEFSSCISLKHRQSTLDYLRRGAKDGGGPDPFLEKRWMALEKAKQRIGS